jgi:hypothetical protein
MSEIYVKITALSKRITHFPLACFNPQEFLVKPYAQDGQNGKPDADAIEEFLPYTIVFQFPNNLVYEKEQMSNCLTNCIPLFQAMLPVGWVYDDEDENADLWVEDTITESQAKIDGYVPFVQGTSKKRAREGEPTTAVTTTVATEPVEQILSLWDGLSDYQKRKVQRTLVENNQLDYFGGTQQLELEEFI